MILFAVSNFHRKALALLLLISFSFPVLNLAYVSVANYFFPPTIQSKLLLDTKLAALRVMPSKAMHGDTLAKQWAVVGELKGRLFKYLSKIHPSHTKYWQELMAQKRVVVAQEVDVQSYLSQDFDQGEVERVAEEVYSQFVQFQASGNPKVWVSLGIVQLHSKNEEQDMRAKIRGRLSTKDVADGRSYCKIELSPTCDKEYKIGYFAFVEGDEDLYGQMGQYLRKQIQAKEGSVMYGPQMILYRDKCYMLYPEVVCDLRHKDKSGYTMAHLRKLARHRLAKNCALQAARQAQREMESMATVPKHKQYTVAFTDNHYSREFRAAVFGTKTGACNYLFEGGKYVVFRVVRTYNSGARESQKIVPYLAQLIMEALTMLKTDDPRYQGDGLR